MTRSIPFVDLSAQQARIRSELDAAIATVLQHGQYIMGPEVARFEDALAELGGSDEAVSCASGTDALILALLALGVGPDDAVLVPAFTFAATAEAVSLVGATPVFVDVDRTTFNVDPDAVSAVLELWSHEGRRPPVGLIAVDLYGRPAPYRQLHSIMEGARGWIVADAAQSLGAEFEGRPVGSLAPVTCTSFFPAKPLGCYGDGGAVLSDDLDLADLIRSLRSHGQGTDRYEHLRIGMTGRLDTLQAAILLEKLKIFPDELTRRAVIAARYSERLEDRVEVPAPLTDMTSTWAQYTVMLVERDRVAEELLQQGIPTAVHYPRSLVDQPAYTGFPCPLDAPVARELASRVLSLPMHPYLDEEMQDEIISSLRNAVAAS